MKWGEPIIMALKKCPKCGMDNILRQRLKMKSRGYPLP